VTVNGEDFIYYDYLFLFNGEQFMYNGEENEIKLNKRKKKDSSDYFNRWIY